MSDLISYQSGIPENPFPSAAKAPGAGASIEIARATQQVQGAIISARRFPRDRTGAFTLVMETCKRYSFAEKACYAYPRGKELVTGPSIRLAEEIARQWGNIDYGWAEIEKRTDETVVEAFAWDLETNTRRSIIFSVPHIRKTKTSQYTLDDPRDIYETVANNASRRMRQCVLGVVPGDVIESAVEVCNRTLAGGSSEPIIDRIRKMLGLFKEVGVPQAAIEKRLGHNVDMTIETELAELRKIYLSIRDGVAKREDFFEIGKVASETAKDLTTQFLGPQTSVEAEKPAEVAPPPAVPEPLVEEPPSAPPMRPNVKAYDTIERLLEDELPDGVRERLVGLAARRLEASDHLTIPQAVRQGKAGKLKSLDDLLASRTAL